MRLKKIIDLLEGNLLCGEERLNDEVEFAFASDLMSDVLTVADSEILLITGLANIQTIRTSEMSDISHVLLVRNKRVTQEMLSLAIENGIALIESPYSMFKVCGILYNLGIKPVF
ncbi:hypothetical protein JXR93_03675 [bacterium]|nr:hypothetical protein [bacterium]